MALSATMRRMSLQGKPEVLRDASNTRLSHGAANQMAKKEVAVDGKSDSKTGINKKTSFSFDDFELGRKLGEGIFGHVYLVQTKREHKRLALKVLYKRSLEQELVVDQLRREVEIHTRLRHPNIVRMYSYFHDADKVYLLLEYCPGGTLLDALRASKDLRFEEQRAVGVIKQVASALALCHRFQIIHRDIKPENVLFGVKGEAKLADFGWAVADRTTGQVKRRTLCGTVDYLAPEMVNGEEYDDRVDSWMLGVLTYEVIVGLSPFKGDSETETWDKITTMEPAVPEFLSPQASDFLQKLLDKDPEQRMTMRSVLKHPWIRAGDDIV